MGGDEGVEEGKTSADLEGEAKIKRMEREHAVAACAAAEKEMEALESQLEKKRSEAGKLEKHVEQRRTEEQAAQEELEEVSKAQDKLLNKRTMLTDTVAQKQHMIRELGKQPDWTYYNPLTFTLSQTLPNPNPTLILTDFNPILLPDIINPNPTPNPNQ